MFIRAITKLICYIQKTGQAGPQQDRLQDYHKTSLFCSLETIQWPHMNGACVREHCDIASIHIFKNFAVYTQGCIWAVLIKLNC